jgi:sugar phosphate isomerase/epimerase
MIAISTLWNSKDAENAEEIMSQILDMGFEAIELDYYLTGALVNELKELLDNALQVVSLHNFCPIPDILPKEMAGSDAFLLSSSDREERERAVEYTIKTMELADSFETRIVICHLGHVDMDDPTENLIELYDKGEKESDDFESLLQKSIEEREAKRQRNLDAVFFSLDKLIRRAEKLDVFIGVENRQEFRQIPGLDEIGIIMSEFQGANIGYWHNTGYAQIHDNLDIASHEDLLRQYSDSMIGIHLHDVKSNIAHLAPGMGDLDFKMVSEYLPQNAVRVLQLTPEATREEVMEGSSHLEELGI